jgi:hypothetical protein
VRSLFLLRKGGVPEIGAPLSHLMRRGRHSFGHTPLKLPRGARRAVYPRAAVRICASLLASAGAGTSWSRSMYPSVPSGSRTFTQVVP